MTESGFERVWQTAARFRSVSPQLHDLLRACYFAAAPSTLRELRRALEGLFEFLASGEGRTDANCSVTDRFFGTPWEDDWNRLPAAWVNILEDVAGTLHDAIHAPAIARTFESTPEQLLERVRRLPERGA